MSDEAAVDVPGRREALLAQYRQTRQDIRRKVDRNDRRFVRGVAVIGLVVGYAFQTDTQILVVFVPLLLGFLYVLGIQRWVDVDFLAKQCLDVEAAIDVAEFGWETNYGRLVPENERRVRGQLFSDRAGVPQVAVRWNGVPHLVGYVVGFSTYVSSIVLSLLVLVDPATSPVAGTARFYAAAGVVAFYVLFSGALVLVRRSEQRVRRELLAERSRGS